MTNLIETNVYEQEPPWSSIGTYVGEELLDSKSAIIKAGLDWKVEKQNLYASPDQIHSQEVQSHKAIVRTTDQHVLGVVGNQFIPVQNLEAFDFMDSLVESGQMKYHTVGSVGDGEKVWMLGKVSESEILPKDKLDHYLFLFNAHNGTSSLRVVFTTIRVICANMAQAAFNQHRGSGVQLRHTKNLKDKVEQAKEVLGLAKKKFEKFDEWARLAAKTQLSANQWNEILENIIPMPPKEERTQRLETRRQNVRNTINQLYYDGIGQDIQGVAGTGWAAYNAVVEYSNYHRATRGDNPQERRFMGSMFGESHNLIQRTMQEISKAA